jgi:hypothetical protein
MWRQRRLSCVVAGRETAMTITLSLFRTDIGSIGAHIAPSRRLFDGERAV